MTFEDKVRAKSEVGEVCKLSDEPGQLDETLRDFRLSVHAWSEAVYGQPRTVTEPSQRRMWRLVVGWALGCLLVVGGLSGGVYKQHQSQEIAKVAAARTAEQQRLAAQQNARLEEEDLLAKVDHVVSREVPSAMEPLAQLMAGDEIQ